MTLAGARLRKSMTLASAMRGQGQRPMTFEKSRMLVSFDVNEGDVLVN